MQLVEWLELSLGDARSFPCRPWQRNEWVAELHCPALGTIPSVPGKHLLAQFTSPFGRRSWSELTRRQKKKANRERAGCSPVLLVGWFALAVSSVLYSAVMGKLLYHLPGLHCASRRFWPMRSNTIFVLNGLTNKVFPSGMLLVSGKLQTPIFSFSHFSLTKYVIEFLLELISSIARWVETLPL